MATITPDPIVLDDVEWAQHNEVPAEKHVGFSVDGHEYALDLSADNFKLFHEALAPWVEVAQPAGVRPGRVARKAPHQNSSPADRERTQKIREWANEQGMNVSERGRLPRNVMEAYDAAH